MELIYEAPLPITAICPSNRSNEVFLAYGYLMQHIDLKGKCPRKAGGDPAYGSGSTVIDLFEENDDAYFHVVGCKQTLVWNEENGYQDAFCGTIFVTRDYCNLFKVADYNPGVTIKVVSDGYISSGMDSVKYMLFSGDCRWSHSVQLSENPKIILREDSVYVFSKEEVLLLEKATGIIIGKRTLGFGSGTFGSGKDGIYLFNGENIILFDPQLEKILRTIDIGKQNISHLLEVEGKLYATIDNKLFSIT